MLSRFSEVFSVSQLFHLNVTAVYERKNIFKFCYITVIYECIVIYIYKFVLYYSYT